MKEYYVKIEKTIVIKAINVDEAKKVFRDENPNTTPLYFDDIEEDERNEVVGICEVSGLPIFDHDQYLSDKEGVIWLKQFDK
jgi:hypothetical protein